MQSSNAHAGPTTAHGARLVPSAAIAQSASGRRQATLAAFSRRVLSVVGVTELLDAATRAVSHGLGATHVAAFEYDRAADALHLRAGDGWRDGLVGRAISHPGTEFHEGYALDRTEPIVVADHNSEIRFAASPLLVEHGVLSSVCVAVRHVQSTFGLLGAYATRPRAFTQDDAQFLQVVADVVSTALARLEAEAALEARSGAAAAVVQPPPDGERGELADASPSETVIERLEAPASGVWPPESRAWTLPAAGVDLDSQMEMGSATRPEAQPEPESAPPAEPESGPPAEPAPAPPAEPASQPRPDFSIDILALAGDDTDLQATLQGAAEAIARSSGFPMVAIELWDSDRETITGAATVFPGQEPSEPVEWPLHQTLAGPTIASAQPRFEETNSTTPERRDALQRIGAATFVCFPLIVREQVIGALSLASREPRAQDEDLSAWLTQVCRAVSWLVQSHRDGQAMRETHEISAQVLDGLTQGVALVDPNGHVRRVNAALARILKRPATELEGRRIVEFMYGESEAETSWTPGTQPDEPRRTTLVAGDGACVEADVVRRPLLQGDDPVGTLLVVDDAPSARATPEPARRPDPEAVAQRERAAHVQAVESLDGERSRLARALENGLSPILSALQLSLQTKAQDRDDLATDLRALGIALSTVHRLAHRLHPAALEGSTLSSLLQDVLVSNVESRRVRLDVVGSEPLLDVAFKTGVYRLIQDAVSGAFEHAASHDVQVRLGWSAEHVDLDIESHSTNNREDDVAGRDAADAARLEEDGAEEGAASLRDEGSVTDGDAQVARETWTRRLETRAALLDAEVTWPGESAARATMRVRIPFPAAAEPRGEISD